MKMCMLIVYVATVLCLKAPNIGELVTLNVTKRWLLSLSSVLVQQRSSLTLLLVKRLSTTLSKTSSSL